MHLYQIKGKSLLIAWSPKCACTSIARWAAELNGLEQDNQNNHACRLALRTEGYKLNISAAINAPTGARESIAIAYRNPLARLVSAFVNKFVISNGKPIQPVNLHARNLFPIKHIIQSSTTSYKGINSPSYSIDPPTANISLAHFLSYIADESIPLDSLNPHFRPQLISLSSLRQLLHLMDKRFVFPLKTERFVDDLTRINTFIGADYIPPKSNESSLPSGWIRTDDIRAAFMSSKELINERVVPSISAASSFLEKGNITLSERFCHDFAAIDILDSMAPGELFTNTHAAPMATGRIPTSIHGSGTSLKSF